MRGSGCYSEHVEQASSVMEPCVLGRVPTKKEVMYTWFLCLLVVILLASQTGQYAKAGLKKQCFKIKGCSSLKQNIETRQANQSTALVVLIPKSRDDLLAFTKVEQLSDSNTAAKTHTWSRYALLLIHLNKRVQMLAPCKKVQVSK